MEIIDWSAIVAKDDDISKKYKNANYELKSKLKSKPYSPQKVIKYIPDIQKEVIKLLIGIDFTEGQKELLNILLENLYSGFKDKDMFVFSGRAGTGKSMSLSVFIKICNMFGIKTLVGTFTGKASQVLREKGVESNTLHSIMYKPLIDPKTGGITGWSKNSEIECDILFVDEYSTLDDKLVQDILHYDKVTVFLGDNQQLPPVQGESTLLTNTDLELTKICRQAEGNPIIHYANYVRDGNRLKVGIKEKNEQGLFATINENHKSLDKIKQEYDLILCGKNNTRKYLNEEYRFNKGYTGVLNVGEKLIILKNVQLQEVFNGQIVQIKEIISEPYEDTYGFEVMDIITTDDKPMTICVNTLKDQNYNYQEHLFKSGKSKKRSKKSEDEVVIPEPIFVNYAYAITVHKLQGSSAEKVLVFANDLTFMYYMQNDKEKGKEMYIRALYTAITRAEKNCVVVL